MKRITFTVNDGLHKKIKIKTIKENTTIRDVATVLMTCYLKEDGNVRMGNVRMVQKSEEGKSEEGESYGRLSKSNK